MIYLITHRRIPPSHIVSLGIRLVFSLLFYLHMYNVINLMYTFFFILFVVGTEESPILYSVPTPQHNNKTTAYHCTLIDRIFYKEIIISRCKAVGFITRIIH